MNRIRTHNVSGDLATDYAGSCKSNYHTITITTTPLIILKYHSNLSIPDVVCTKLDIYNVIPFQNLAIHLYIIRYSSFNVSFKSCINR